MSEGPDARRDGPLDGEVNVDVERSAAKAVLGNDSFRNLLLASATSSIGDWIGLFALLTLAETLAGTSRVGALTVSFVMIARIVPTLFIAPVAGVFVDRWDRKRTMIATDVVRGVVMLAVAFVGDAFQLVIATFAVEVAAALFIPAKDATVPTIVKRERLVQANQLALFSTYATLPLGALLAAVVISITKWVAASGMEDRFPDAMAFLADRPEAVPIILNALTFFGSIWFLRRMVVPDDHRQAHEERVETGANAVTEFRDGLRFIADKPLIRALVVGIMTAFLAAGAVIGVGEFFASILNAGDAGFATLGFVVGTGLVAGIVGAGPLSRHIAKERLFAPGVLVAGVALVAAALMPTLLLASLPAFVMGIGAGVAFILGYTMLQEYSEDEIRGRVFAAFNTAVRMSLFTALVLGPLTLTVLGIERTASQIRQGTEAEFDDIEEFDAEGTYPYQIGGVRLTLIMAGLVAAGGAVWTGLSIRQVLARREDEEDEEGEEGEALAGLTEFAAEGRPTPRPTEARGLFVVFEGGEGAGKSTQVRLLCSALEDRGHQVVVTREPGGTPTGEAIREVLLDADGAVTPRAEALLYAAARAEHAADVLAPAIEDGAIVLCDRYVDSSIVYQGVGRDLGVDVVADLNLWATEGLQPDLVVLLDVPAEVGLARARDVEHPDRLEAAGLDFHERVNEGFRERARWAPQRYLVLDATGGVDDLQARIRERVMDLLGHDDGPGPDGGAGSSGATDDGRRDAHATDQRTAPEARGEPLFANVPDVPAVPSAAPLEPRVAPATQPGGGRAMPGWLALPGETDSPEEQS